MKTLLLLLLLAVPVAAQTDLPDRGTIADLKGKVKIYIVASAKHIKSIEKATKKTFTFVSSPSDAEFFLEYRVLSMKEVSALQIEIETGQMDAFFYRDNRKVVAWSDSGKSGNTAETLAKRFVKAWVATKPQAYHRHHPTRRRTS